MELKNLSIEPKNLSMTSEIKDSVDNANKLMADDDFGSLYVKDELFLLLIDDLIKRIPDNQS